MDLNSLYELNEEKVFAYLETSKDKNYREEGYRYEKVDNEIHLIGWQYTKIKFLNINIKLYIFLRVITDLELNIKSIKLSNNFKGSQGIKCQSNILNEHINKTFINEQLTLKNKKIKDYKQSRCRHIYEILYGMSDFITTCSNETSGFYHEKTTLTIGLSKIKLTTKMNLNNKENTFIIDINNLNKIKLDNQYNIIKSNNKLISYFNNQEILNEQIISNTNMEFYQNTLKYIFKVWQQTNTNLNLDNTLSFSLLFPTSLYSFIVQIITIHKKVYDKEALNKCLTNFQIINNEALCLGFEGETHDNI